MINKTLSLMLSAIGAVGIWVSCKGLEANAGANTTEGWALVYAGLMSCVLLAMPAAAKWRRS